MKKTLLLSLIVAVVFSTYVASAAELYETKINYSNNTVTISGDAGAENAGRYVTLIVTNPDKNFSDFLSEDNVLNWADQTTVNKDGSFEFLFSPRGDTGDYSYFVTVSDTDIVLNCSEPYRYYSEDEAAVVWGKIKNALERNDPSDIQWAIENRAQLLQIDDSKFNALSTENKTRVLSGIMKLSIANLDEFKVKYDETIRANALYAEDDPDVFKSLFENELSGFSPITVRMYNEADSDDSKKSLIRAKLMESDFLNLAELEKEFNNIVLIEKLNSLVLWTEVDTFIRNEYKAWDSAESVYAQLKYPSSAAVILLGKLPYSDMDAFKADLYSTAESCRRSETDNGGSNGSSSSGGSSKKSGSNISFQAPSVSDDSSKTEPNETSDFSDVTESHWAYKDIIKMYQKGIISGYEDKSFKPDENVTRAEFVKMVTSAFEITPKSGDEMIFSDVSADEWYWPYLYAGYANNIISGSDGGRFMPDAYITREEMASILYRTLKLKSVVLPAGNASVFADDAYISDYAHEAVSSLSEAKIINGYENGEFRPEFNASRAESSVMINRIFEFMGMEE